MLEKGIALITGANRGIGLGFVQALLNEGFKVIAGVRNPAKATALSDMKNKSDLRIVELDISSEASVKNLSSILKDFSHLDLLVNNAGVFTDNNARFQDLEVAQITQAFETNVLGAFRVTRTCLPFLTKSSDPLVAQITSLMGSIADNTSGGYYAYRISKAALNMMNKSFSIDHPQISSVVLHPGWVKTDMGGANAQVSVSTSVSGMLKVLRTIGKSHSGKFFDYQGKELPW